MNCKLWATNLFKYWIFYYLLMHLNTFNLCFVSQFQFTVWYGAQYAIYSELVNAFKNWIFYILKFEILFVFWVNVYLLNSQYHVSQRMFVSFHLFFSVFCCCCFVHYLISISLCKPIHFLLEQVPYNVDLMPIPFRKEQSLLILIIWVTWTPKSFGIWDLLWWYLRWKRKKISFILPYWQTFI